jgi:hypothetical protein
MIFTPLHKLCGALNRKIPQQSWLLPSIGTEAVLPVSQSDLELQ